LSYGTIENSSRGVTKNWGSIEPCLLVQLDWFELFQSIAKAALDGRPRTLFLPKRNVVFVVDDDPGMLISVKRLLRANGYDSSLFSSAKAFKNQVDFEDACCVVLDINLEDGSGIELRHGLKAAGNSVPVIYMTGNEDPAVRKAALDSGCIAFLTKPFSVQELIGPLEKASAGRS
jgi:FixJ family two-component response regulator